MYFCCHSLKSSRCNHSSLNYCACHTFLCDDFSLNFFAKCVSLSWSPSEIAPLNQLKGNRILTESGSQRRRCLVAFHTTYVSHKNVEKKNSSFKNDVKLLLISIFDTYFMNPPKNQDFSDFLRNKPVNQGLVQKTTILV